MMRMTTTVPIPMYMARILAGCGLARIWSWLGGSGVNSSLGAERDPDKADGERDEARERHEELTGCVQPAVGQRQHGDACHDQDDGNAAPNQQTGPLPCHEANRVGAPLLISAAGPTSLCFQGPEGQKLTDYRNRKVFVT